MALTFAPLSVEFFDDYQRTQQQVQRAIAAGPPPPAPLAEFSGRTGAFGEVHLNGVLRADLGVQTVTFAETGYNFAVMDGKSGGPLLAVLVPGERAGQVFTTLVNAADATGRVNVQGFLAPTRVGQISRRLAQRNGVVRDLLVIEPFDGTRSAALAARSTEAQATFFVSAALTGLFVLLTLWRFRQWRNRRADKKQRRARRRADPASVPQPVAPQAAQMQTPWGGQVPRKPQAPKPASRPTTIAARDTDPHPIIIDPPFTSVFPGGGSGFKFKTADQIIRQSFGTFSGTITAKDDS